MPEPGPLEDDSDEAFLDRAFELAVERLEEGASVSVGELLGGRERLRAQMEQLVVDARTTACVRDEALPHVSGYSIVEELGRGGMGAVYLARQEALGGRRVALKLLPSSAVFSARARERFLREARTLANVRHPHVVTVHDVVESDQVCAYAMEWVDGASLAGLIQRARDSKSPTHVLHATLQLVGARALEEYTVFVCRTAIAVARALGALHRAGLVHRDVKPSNVLLRRDGTALLSDFGLAHASDAALTKSGEFVGTVLYASPEQLDGDAESLDARSDVYALGVTLYHALTFHLPFDEPGSTERRASTPTGMLRLLEGRSPVPLRARDPKLPRDLETIVAMAIESEPTRRYESADEFADDLERLLSLQPIHARPASALSRAAKFVRRNRSAARGLIVGSAASIALALLAVVCFVFAPRWADEHVREARLALLDPVYANALFVREQFGAPASAPRTLQTDDGLRRAITSYEAALRWNWFDRSIGAERDVVARALDHKTPEVSATDPRLAGLGAYLAGDVDGALKHWSDAERLRDPRTAPDPLVEAMLGVLLLVRDEPARAYPRLREACRMFPDVGFLATYHADAAVRCGDHETAERLLRSARDMHRLDPLGAHERVTADLYAATGRDDAAESLYRAALQSPVATLHLARLLDRCGRLDEALEQYLVAFERLNAPALRAEYSTVLERWWTSLSDSERSQAIAATLELAPSDRRSLVARLRGLRLASAEDERPMNSGLFATLRRWRSSPPLQSLGLPELAGILEVEDMKLWSGIPNYSNLLRSLQAFAWRSPWPRAASRGVHALASKPKRSTARVSAVTLGAALAVALGAGAVSGQSCPSPRYSAGMGYDSARQRTVLFGGAAAPFNLNSETWEWDGSTWSLRSTTGPSPRADFTATPYDSARGVNVLFGGGLSFGSYSGETWEWNGISWSLRSTAGPSPREAHAIAYDAARGRTVIFSGLSQSAGYSDAQTWEWDGTTWSQKFPAASPSPRIGASMAFDASRGVCVLFGGANPTAGPANYSDTWEWNGVNWLQRTPANVPPARLQAAMDFDSVRGVVVMFGGAPYSPNVPRNDTWEWDGTNWTLTDNGMPARSYTQGAFDSVRNRFVQYGGLGSSGSVIGDTWEYDGATSDWCQVAICPLVSTFCTAGTTSSGCSASMSSSGTPSIGATSGFTVSCSNVEGQKFGLIFYGVCGAKASPWAPGSTSYLCVKSPVQRTVADNSGGTAGACNGAFSIDFLTYLSTHPLALGQPMGAGQLVTAQAWFRDPPAPGTTNLSNGLQFVTTP
ncbi:MAG: protein kinase [Planctomycetes bacterium]|nr:protein kinase [Planctomycetota bacterium]